MNVPKSHCPHGHEYTKANTYLRANGARRCAECGRQWQREYYLANLKRELARSREYRLSHREENREYAQKYRLAKAKSSQ